MTRRLLRDKSLCDNSKGVYGIIAAIFLVLVVLALYANVFVFMLNQNVLVYEVVSEANQEDIDRKNEIITVSNANYAVEGDKVRVEAVVTNNGPVSVQIVTLWVFDATIRKYGYNDTLNVNLKTGDMMVFVGSNALIVTVEGSHALDVFAAWFVSVRGNLIPFEEQQETVFAKLAQGIGSLELDFYRLLHFTYETSEKLMDYPTGTIGFDIPKNTYIAFACYLTNLDPSKETIVFDSHSLFWQPGRPGVADLAWFIVNVDANGTVGSSYSPVTLNYGERKMLVFASDKDLDIGGFARQRTPNVETTVATFILLHGTKGSDPYAQNIPFVSIFYY